MAKVRTVLGDVDPSEIGITLIHEHIFFKTVNENGEDRQIIDFDGQIDELSVFIGQGGGCVVDQTTIELGRQPTMLARLAQETGLHIVASTGFYHEPWLPDMVREADVEAVTQIMIKDVDQGIDDTDIRAGFIGEIGSSEISTTELEEKVLRAAGQANQATGAAISTHTVAGAEALRQIDILLEEGVDPQRVIISHVDLDHVEHLKMVAERGVFLSFDTIGQPRFRDEYRMTGDEIRLETLLAIVKAGFEDQIVLSHDIRRVGRLRVNGGHGYGHLLGTFIPLLLKNLSEATINKFLVQNPCRALAF